MSRFFEAVAVSHQGDDFGVVDEAVDHGGGDVGFAVLWLSLVDNPRMGLVTVEVHPEHRRRGIGTALLRGVLAEMTAAR